VVDKNAHILVDEHYPETDNFIVECTCDIIKKYNPDLIMIHLCIIDDQRHEYGIFNEKVNNAVFLIDQMIGKVMGAIEESGKINETNLVILSDHGQMDIKRVINVNALLADFGFVHADNNGTVKSLDAYSLSNGMSALIYLRDKEDLKLYKKVHSVLNLLCDEGVYGIGKVFTEPESKALHRLGGDFSFVIETDGYSSFGDDWKRPLVKQFDISDYRYGRATHGYLPEKGPQPMLFAKGPNIKQNTVIEKCNIVDEASTFAKILGIDFKNKDGACIDGILA
jgi:predicted AlkP superfamily pyrophosphatase or phosphodiesterase